MRYFCLYLIVSIHSIPAIQAQGISPSNTYVRTCLNDVECASMNSSSLLFFDEARGRFYMKLDFNAMKTGVDSVDFWLEDLNDTYLYFRAPMSRDQLPNLSAYGSTTLKIDGQLFINNIWRPLHIDLALYKAESDLMSNSANGNRIDAYKANLSFSFLPSQYNIHKKPSRLKNVVFIGIAGGHINLLTPGQEKELGEAYEQ